MRASRFFLVSCFTIALAACGTSSGAPIFIDPACGPMEDIGLDERPNSDWASANEALADAGGTHEMEGPDFDGAGASRLVVELTPGNSARTSAATDHVGRGACGTEIDVDAHVFTLDGAVDVGMTSLDLLVKVATLRTRIPMLPPPYPSSPKGALTLTVTFVVGATDRPRFTASVQPDDDSFGVLWTDREP